MTLSYRPFTHIHIHIILCHSPIAKQKRGRIRRGRCDFNEAFFESWIHHEKRTFSSKMAFNPRIAIKEKVKEGGGGGVWLKG